jgi:ABC-type transporter Mla subunit MlaD
VVARAAAGGALLTAIVVLAVLLLTSGSSYTLRINFQDAGGLVSGNLVHLGRHRQLDHADPRGPGPG